MGARRTQGVDSRLRGNDVGGYGNDVGECGNDVGECRSGVGGCRNDGRGFAVWGRSVSGELGVIDANRSDRTCLRQVLNGMGEV